MTDMMQALMMTAIRQHQLVDVPLPAVEHSDDVVLKVQSVGVCGSDLHGFTGESGRRIPPLIMGHEAAGEVIRVGDEVTKLRLGDRVAVQTVRFCGTCSQCLAGNQNLCQKRRIMGMNEPGAYAQYVRWRSESLFKLPDELSYEEAALAEPLSVSTHAVGLAHIKPYDTAFIVGAGTIGLLALSVMKLMGTDRIIVSDTSDARLAVARAIGADVTVNPKSDDVKKVVEAYTDGNGVDVSLEAVGLSATAQQTLDVTRNKGTVIWIGNNQRKIEIDMQAIVTRELNVIGSYGMSSKEFERALHMLVDDQIPTEHLINRRAALSEGPRLFDELLAAPEIIKCVINF